MKSGEYTYRVAIAYRIVIDDPQRKPEAKKLLSLDFGREKTSYFLGKDVKGAISNKTVAGVFLGKVERVEGNSVFISSKIKVEIGFRLCFHIPGKEKQEIVKVRSAEEQKTWYKIDTDDKRIKRKVKFTSSE